VIAALRQAAEETSGAEHQIDIAPKLRGELRAIMNNYFAHLVGHKLRMPEHLGALAH